MKMPMFSKLIVFVSVCSAVFAVAETLPVWEARPGNFYGNGPSDQKFITLTFDDGPGKETPRILEILARYQIHATFFMEGSQVDRYPEIAKQVVTAGHEVGNHSYTHVNFYRYKKPDARTRLREELQKAAAAIQRATGVQPVLLRMPHGYFRSWVREVARAEGYTVVHWSFGCDWKPMSAETMAQAYIVHARPGAIFLFHDGGKTRQRTVEALPVIFDTLQRAGYTFGPIRTWLRSRSSVK
ncbi:MAG: polysaccharide deacetylase family protein [Elusimicrobia bacterium]|nr:polysaccharide deacetylase family protein [Elusimicrobiota bacterium]